MKKIMVIMKIPKMVIVIIAQGTEPIRSWDFPRSLKALETFNVELGKVDYPGLYILIESKLNKVYSGEAKVYILGLLRIIYTRGIK
jgi:hypothetical protein